MGNLLKYGSFDEDTAAAEKEDLENSGGAEMLKLKVGRNIMRILPPPVGARTPFKTVYQHFIELPGNKKSFICARLEAKKSCAICAKIDEMRASPHKADRDAADDMYARRRVFVNVIDRTNPDSGPKVLAVGKQVHEQLLALREETVGGDYCHPEEGFDVTIERTGTGKNDTKYKVFLARKPSPLAGTVDEPDIDLMQEWIDTQTNLANFARLPDQAEVAGLLSAGGGEEEEEEKPVARRAARTTTSASTSARSAPAATTPANGRAAASAARRAARSRSAEDDAIDVEGTEVEA